MRLAFREIGSVKRNWIVAFFLAVSACGGIFYLLYEAGGGALSEQALGDSREEADRSVTPGGVNFSGPNRASAAASSAVRTAGGSPSKSVLVSEGFPETGSPAQPGSARAGRRPGANSSGAKAAGKAGAGKGGNGNKEKLRGTKPLQGAQLVQALAKALEEKDEAALQGLLISSLTKKGTRFTAEELPSLFEALEGTDDYGLQKLVLTHLKRIDAPPEELIDGYVDHLKNAQKLTHSEEVLGEIVRLGGDAALEGLKELVLDTESPRLSREAAGALGKLGDERGVPVLAGALESVSEYREARPYVAALSELGGEKAVRAVVDYTAKAGNESAAPMLSQIRDKKAGPILAEALTRRSTEAFQNAALRQLRRFATPEILPHLGRYLDRAEGPLAARAISVIGHVRDRKAVSILLDYAARHPDSPVGRTAAKTAERVLRGLGGRQPGH